jgi:hypothetical protein
MKNNLFYLLMSPATLDDLVLMDVNSERMLSLTGLICIANGDVILQFINGFHDVGLPSNLVYSSWTIGNLGICSNSTVSCIREAASGANHGRLAWFMACSLVPRA